MKGEDKNKFNPSCIKHLLDEKLYEVRGMSEKEYISYCKKIWDATPSKKGFTKMIFDECLPYEEGEFLQGIHLDHMSEYVKDLGEYDEPLTFKQKRFMVKWEKNFENLMSQKMMTKQDLEKFRDEYLQELEEHKKDGIRCLYVTGGKVKGGKMIKTSIEDTLDALKEKTFESSPELETYFIALFDILGFSKLLETIGVEGIQSKYDELMKLVIDSHGYKSTVKIEVGDNLYYPGVSYVPIKHTYFSDTIFMWAEGNPAHFSAFLSRCADLVCESLRIGLPLRGAICCGEAIMHPEKNKFLGNAIVEAAKMEASQAWIGATLCSSVFLNNLFPEIDEELVVPLYVNHLKPIPPETAFKQKVEHQPKHERPYLTLDWIYRWENKYPDDDLEVRLKDLQKKAPEKNKKYYENTLDFIFYSTVWDFTERGDFLRSKFFSVSSSLNEKGITQENFPEHMDPVVILFKEGIYRYGYILPINEKMEIKDTSLLAESKTHFLFLDFLYGGFQGFFYEEIQTKMFEEFETKILIEKFQLSDIYSLDGYALLKDMESWDDTEKIKAELLAYVKKNKLA